MKTNIKNISNIKTGFFGKPVKNGDVIHLQLKHFDENGNLSNSLFPDLKKQDISEKHLLIHGDILFAAKGNKNFATVYEKHNEPAVASTSFFVIRLTDNKILPQYCAWYLNQPKIISFLKDQARGTSIPSITKTDLEDLEIQIPTIEKQKLIITLHALMQKEVYLRTKIQIKRKQLIQLQIIKEINKNAK